MRTIDADAFIRKIRKQNCEECVLRKGIRNGKMQYLYEIGGVPCRACAVEDMLDEVEDAPTIEPKTGHWILKSHMWECDKCGCRIRRANPFKGNIWNYNFCPNCGAKMEKE